MGLRGRSVGASLAAAALAVNGCSQLVGIPEREYADAAPDAGSQDAPDGEAGSFADGSTDAKPGAEQEGGMDAPLLDGAQDSDAALVDARQDADGGDGPSEAGTTFCQLLPASPVPLLCDDFEEGSASLSPWTLTGPTLDAAESSAPPSPGHSLLADLPVGSGSNAASAKWGASAGYAHADLELAFDLFIDDAPSDANTILATIGVDNYVRLALQAQFAGQGAQVYEVVNGTSGTPVTLGTAIWQTQSWFRVDIKLHIVPGSASTLTALTLQALPNGTPQVAVSNFSLSSSWTTHPPTIALESAPQSSTTQDARVHFDNVVVFAQ